ncbi:aminotransferase class V-fold PLP-dependent enzyme [Arenibacter sp. GZD96]|uniref:aminotransferase class V-fold PLP-dependent enzyme n=1 Tax=Aurantibrevibacter litoralis TaxID=3106030 RepID=UPI002AFFBCC0|nr:aminotransferase class V-fold PLP-dependent enzyme [Arenibacter sp. GZD-96]MEA1784639.1 aminotransferase class V-fold PLP-dependent enzyme [Arenibacter sp. GZD-96]
MEKIRNEFPVAAQHIYANTAACGLLYHDLWEWRQEHDLDYLIGGSHFKAKSDAFCIGVRQTVSQFFGCNPTEVALIPNFSLGLNLLLEGLDKRRRVLLLDRDYPSINLPFERREFPISYVAVTENLEAEIEACILREEISVLALSLTQWLDGVQIDLGFLQTLKETYPDVLIIADGTQFCGTTNFNFNTSGIDILGASAYKWLLGGYGCGFFLVKAAVHSQFNIKSIGLHSAAFSAAQQEHPSFCALLEPGHLDTFNFGSLQFSLKYIEKLGLNSIESHLSALSQKAKKEFAALGLLSDVVLKRNSLSTIFNIKGDDQLFQHVTKHHVVCSQRGDGIRLSFHFYNLEKDIDSIVKILKMY